LGAVEGGRAEHVAVVPSNLAKWVTEKIRLCVIGSLQLLCSKPNHNHILSYNCIIIIKFSRFGL
jgi:hypothetical protein